MILIPKKSIIHISNQTIKWRVLIGLCLSSGAIMILGIIALSLDFRLSKILLSLAGENVWGVLTFLGMVTALAAMIGLCLMIKCPRCKLKWFWHAMAKDHKRNIAIGYLSHCPRCNYPDEERKDAEPDSISQKPILEVSNQKTNSAIFGAHFSLQPQSCFLGLYDWFIYTDFPIYGEYVFSVGSSRLLLCLQAYG